jgi:hypothetical protein
MFSDAYSGATEVLHEGKPCAAVEISVLTPLQPSLFKKYHLGKPSFSCTICNVKSHTPKETHRFSSWDVGKEPFTQHYYNALSLAIASPCASKFSIFNLEF